MFDQRVLALLLFGTLSVKWALKDGVFMMCAIK